MSADYKLCRGRNPVYSLLYLHNPVPLAVHRRVQEIFPERKKREGKKNRRKKESKGRNQEGRKEGKMWVINECSQGQIINKVHYNEYNIY